MYRNRSIRSHRKTHKLSGLSISNVSRLSSIRHLGKGNYKKVMFMLFIGVVFSIRVLFTAKVATEGGRIKSYENEIQMLTEEIASVSMEIAQMSSLATIEKRATDELQMGLSKEGIVFLEGHQGAIKIAQN